MLSSETYTLEYFSEQLAHKRISAVQLVEQTLQRIHDPGGQGRVTFTRVFDEQALQDAAQSDARRQAGQPASRIDGIPISVKDLFDVHGYTTMAGSRVLADRPVAQRDAMIVKRLREAGAIIVGTTNMTEFAYSGLGLNPHYGTPLSPWDRQTQRIAGGSSSGAAASVADHMAVGAIGTDTGGSVRIPAAFCSLVGYKPTASRIDMTGTLPLSLSLDSIGPLANSVTSCIWLADVMAQDPLNAAAAKPLSQTRFCVPQSLVFDEADPIVRERFDVACDALREAGAKLTSIELPQLLELSSINAAGGFTAAQAWQWHKDLLAQHADLYDRRVRSRIAIGQSLDENYIAQLQATRQAWIAKVLAEIGPFDAMLMPTVPVVPPALASLEQDDDLYARSNWLILRNPSIINFLDGCAVTLPCHARDQAPVGLMLAAGPNQDEQLLAAALACEQALAAIRT